MQDFIVLNPKTKYLVNANQKIDKNKPFLLYVMNPKFVWDKAKEYFSNAEEVFSKEIPESKIYYRDPKR